ncbi:MAG: 30S ribosome-binding factor RbfA [Desulfobacteraceae bacterium]|nr:MAG: 30S ribosome-binding factor RbfA [Desulfobacteraceae bacterium]
MRPFTRSDRVGGLIKQVLAELLHKHINDPRLAGATITDVEVSRDLRLAKIYFATSGGKDAQKGALDGFARARGFVKRELAQRLALRYMPDLQFYYDESFDYGARIEKLLKAVKEDHADHH